MKWIVVFLLGSCSKNQDSIAEKQEHRVRYEINSTKAGEASLFQYSTGAYIRTMGNTGNVNGWIPLPWSLDTIFQLKDGNKLLRLTVAGINNVNAPAGIVTSSISVDGKKVQELTGVGQIDASLY